MVCTKMEVKLQLTNYFGDDPQYWQNFFTDALPSARDMSIMRWIKPINQKLKKYNATYYIVEDNNDPMDNYVLFDSAADYLFFIMQWS